MNALPLGRVLYAYVYHRNMSIGRASEQLGVPRWMFRQLLFEMMPVDEHTVLGVANFFEQQHGVPAKKLSRWLLEGLRYARS